ncbi:SOUL family heme-binding protein [Sphingobium boeckii]|uniref:Heme-binding protein n=1 Tax=Sphingobium boeckii TaxID=1082345 RepID=A0A7W9AF30_9SPHN|nr:heme-binding protein [Sphingobium boeckii]MBB5684372.1 hypothetical protein [Sphingobium boeckii]
MNPKQKKWTLFGAAAIALGTVAGAGFLYARERRSEKPDYALLDSDGDFELRDYPPLLAVETRVAGKREEALSAGSGVLADYIFAKSRPGQTIEMTAPVLSDRPDAGGWRTRFLMPAIWTRDTLPEAPRDVTIVEIPARRIAATRFTGTAGARTLAAEEAALRRWISDGDLIVQGPAEHAFYNSPIVPGPLRRNEILIPVA